MKHRINGSLSLIPGLALLGLLATAACSGTGKDSLPEGVVLKVNKASIDSARVLETLELYRAKRYEGIQDALNGGVDLAHKLVLFGREMEKLSPDIGKLTYLQTLDVAQNLLSELPGELADLHYLQGFYANGNRLTAFPEQLLLLPLLSSVDLSENQISAIPEGIVFMDQLTRLSLDDNNITVLPTQVYELDGLAILELGGNGLREIPDGIDKLSKLKKLDLANNQLTSLPEGLAGLSASLKDLYIQGNQIPREKIEALVRALPSTKIRF